MSGKWNVAVLVGSGVPAQLRQSGQRACWVVLEDGERRSQFFTSRDAAQAFCLRQQPVSGCADVH